VAKVTEQKLFEPNLEMGVTITAVSAENDKMVVGASDGTIYLYDKEIILIDKLGSQIVGIYLGEGRIYTLTQDGVI